MRRGSRSARARARRDRSCCAIVTLRAAVGACARARARGCAKPPNCARGIDAFAQAAAEHERDMRADLADRAAGAGRRRRVRCAAKSASGSHNSRTARSARSPTRTPRSASSCTHSASASASSRRRSSSKLDGLRDENAKKLDEMRATVDEKLQSTLETRLGESFKQVSDRLEQVHRGLGEMQTLAVGVGDLKRVLGNVKTRGGWGEVQLAALLADALTPQQYEKNVETRRGSNERVEFAIRLPGRDDEGQPCWLPIDAKFPLDDWQRLQEALERADVAAADGGAARARRLPARSRRASIRDKYVEPPQTTDFAILFLPTEGLYAEMLARPGLRRRAAARASRDARRPDEPVGAAQQPADGLSHARDRAALERGVARARRGQDGVPQVRRRAHEDQGPHRQGERGARRRPACDVARSSASCAPSTRCPSPRPCGCSAPTAPSTPTTRPRKSSVAGTERCSTRSASGARSACCARPRCPTRCGTKRSPRCRSSPSTPTTSSRGCAISSCCSCRRRASSARTATR